MNCDRCNGKGEIPLLGPNTTSCPDCGGDGTLKNIIVWRVDGPPREVESYKGKRYTNVVEIRLCTENNRCLIKRRGAPNVVEQCDSYLNVIGHFADCSVVTHKAGG